MSFSWFDFDPDAEDFGFADTQTDRTDEQNVEDMVPIGEIGEVDNILEE